jgi:hypothetical protein
LHSAESRLKTPAIGVVDRSVSIASR